MQSECKFVLPGNHHPEPAEIFESMALWCRQHNVKHDVYGEGELIQGFEQKVADLLGFEAGLFVITGTMTQPTALQLACQTRHCFNVALHQSSHITLWESQGYQMQNRFNALPVGSPYTPWLVDDLKRIPDQLGAVLYELPMREIGGQLPEFDALKDIKSYCREQGIHLHMDGARLWEAAAYYDKSYQEIAQGFNSAYVSLYKGVNGLGGSLLLGDKAFIAEASVWMHRQGGSVYQRSPYVVAAAMQFDARLAAMPALFQRTKTLYKMLSECNHITVNPLAPQANMLHLHLPLSKDAACELRDMLAKEHSIWIGNPKQSVLPNQSYLEWYVGDNLLNMDDDILRQILEQINTLITAKI